MNLFLVPTATFSAAVDATHRIWGRYQHRLAIGHASLGRLQPALRHARHATTHLRRARHDSVEFAVALDTLAACHQALGHLDAAIQARRQAVDILASIAPPMPNGSPRW